MAQRRMFSPKIVSSDAFLDMPTSSRELYFQLGMYADDDGFVNPRFVMRMIGASEDDLNILVGKRFVLKFENGVIVIKHWKINNDIKNDRYHETIYLEQKAQISLKKNGSYTECIQNVSSLDTEVRLGKDRLGESVQALPAPTRPNFFEDKGQQTVILAWLINSGGNSEEFAKQELTKFLAYWTEPNQKGRQRWQAEKFFDVKRRLATWFGRIK